MVWTGFAKDAEFMMGIKSVFSDNIERNNTVIATGILDLDYAMIDMATGVVEGFAPVIHIPDSSIGSLEVGDYVFIRDTNYKIMEVMFGSDEHTMLKLKDLDLD